MADAMDPLYRVQDVQDVARMLKSLEAAKGKKGAGQFQTKKSTFEIKGSNIQVDSWKLAEWDYKKPDLPTYARGLFTTRNSVGEPEIVIRGYDKFFNHGETRETEWENVFKDTRGPYELSVKENGCIIFMSGLADGTLLVCSKHSTGKRHDVDISHADWGEKWVDRHVRTVGKTRQELAKTLRTMNATAVAELCDDEFEEHVLEYSPESAGLYLHGLNLNLPEFATYPHSLVDRFAEEWGFKKTQYLVKDDIEEVKSFLESVAETGNYDGRDTEGFVIRCQSKAGTGQWHDWFFKYKFEEPYLMYRQWRECTRQIIAGKEARYKKHKQITAEYLDFARRKLHGNRELVDAYNHNHGIIKLRDDFLASRGLTGSDIIRDELRNGAGDGEAGSAHDIVFVPVATIGCGKTTLAKTLVNLFGWGHVQNDNLTVKKGKPVVFARACATALESAPAVIADRNSSERRERKQIIEDVRTIIPGAKFICLHYRHDMVNFETIRAVTRERVLSRGDNHQTIHAATKSQSEITGIMDNFLRRFQPVDHDLLPDSDFDAVIDLDPLASTKDNVSVILARLQQDYAGLFEGDAPPTNDDIDHAIHTASLEREVEVKHTIKSRNDKVDRSDGAKPNVSTKKEQRIEYFGVTVAATQVQDVLRTVFSDQSAEVAKMYNTLRAQRRIQPEFHVTLIHRSMAQQHKEMWDHLQRKYEQASAPTDERAFTLPDPRLGLCGVQLERLVWDDRLMAFVVRLVTAADGDVQWHSANKTAHITVGTASNNIKPVESNALLDKWLQVGSGTSGIQELVVPGDVRLDGVVRAVLSRANGTNVRP